MAKESNSKLLKLYRQHKKIFHAWVGLSFFPIIVSLSIYYIFNETIENDNFVKSLAEFLMTLGETILGAGLIGGGIGGVINFIFEELKREEEERKDRIKEWQESREKYKLFRKEMRSKLQQAHDNVELARVLIKSHKSGKTYGEQIRTRIMPSLISLLNFKRDLVHVEDKLLKKNLPYLQVSLNYMIAYLKVLVEEFEKNYIRISNLQSYQDTLAEKTRTAFAELIENKMGGEMLLVEKGKLQSQAEKLFENSDASSNFQLVWNAIKSLDYIRDFIKELRDETGGISYYNKFFLDHYKHSKKILKTRGSGIDQKLINKKNYVAIMNEYKELSEKRNSDQIITNQDSLTRKIMEQELHFDFETTKMKRKAI